jgi:hypothetical protein
MVTELGMSAKIGPINYAERMGSDFLGTELMSGKWHSEQTARLIDEEVERLLKEAYESAERIVAENTTTIEKVADSLLMYETISGDEIVRLQAGTAGRGSAAAAASREDRERPGTRVRLGRGGGYDRSAREARRTAREAGVVAGLMRAAPPRPLRLMGVLNVTPDSFSDGGSWPTSALAVERGVILASQGADILDVGGESTRPGAESVAAEEELRRVLPVVEGLARRVQVAISIDTTKADVARAALDAGATIVNDVSAGLLDPEMLPSRRRPRRDVRPHAQAGNSARHAEGSGVRGRRRRGRRFSSGARRGRARPGNRRRMHLGRSRDRVRQDARAQPRAPRAPPRDRRARVPGLPRRLAQVVHRPRSKPSKACRRAPRKRASEAPRPPSRSASSAAPRSCASTTSR